MDAPLLPGRLRPELFATLAARVRCLDPSRPRVQVSSPIDGRVFGTTPRCSPADVAAAARRARPVQQEWALRSVAGRIEPFTRLHDAILDRQDEILVGSRLHGNDPPGVATHH